MTAMDTTISRADLERAARTKMRLRAGETVDRSELEHAARVKLSLGGAARPDSGLTGGASPSVMGDLLGFRPDIAPPVPSSEPVGGATYGQDARTLSAPLNSPVEGQPSTMGGIADTIAALRDPRFGIFAPRPGEDLSLAESLGRGALRGAGGVVDAGGGLLRAGGQAMDMLGVPGGAEVAGTGRAVSEAAKTQQGLYPADPNRPYSGAVGEAVPGMAAALAAGPAGPAVFAGQGAGSAYGRTMDATGNPMKALAAGAGSGAVNALVAPLQLGAVRGITPGLANVLASRVNGAVGRFLAGAGADLTIGGVANVAQAAAEDAIDVATGANPEAFKDFDRQAAVAAVVGATLSAYGAGRAGLETAARGRTVVGMPDQPVTATRPQDNTGPRPGGAADSAGSTLPPGDAIAPSAPTPDQARARAAAAVPVMPDSSQSGPPLEAAPPSASQVRPQGVLSRSAAESPQPSPVPTASDRAPNPGQESEGPSGVAVPSSNPIRSTDTLAPGETVTDAKGQRFTVGPTLESGKVVVRREDGRAVRLTAGEMEARGWRRRAPDGLPTASAESAPQPPSPATEAPSSAVGRDAPAAPEVSIRRVATPESGTVSSPNDTSRVGPPPAEVANPPGMPKGEAALVEPTEPGFWKSLRDRAQQRINERAAAQRDAEAQYRGTGARRGSAGSLDPRTLADRAVILASHIAEAGVSGAKAIKAKALELFGEPSPEVVRAAYRMLRDGQGPDGQVDAARLELAAHDALTEAQTKARTAPNESADVREMMAKREGDRRVAAAKADGKQKVQDAREAEQYLRRDAVAAERAKGQIKADAAEATRKEQAARDKTRMDVAVGLEREAGQQSADIREGMAKRAGEIALSKAAQQARQDRQAMREAFALKADDQKATRQALAKLAEDQLEPSDRAKVLRTIASASSDADARRAVERILNVEKVSDLRAARKELKGTTGKKAPDPQTPQPSLASEIMKELGAGKVPKKFRAGRIGPREVAKLRTNYRDALAPVVEAVRSDHTTGVGKLADFIQGETDAGRSNAFDDSALNVLRSAEGKTLGELDAQQLRAVNDAIEHVAHLSDNANKAQVLGEKRDLDALRTDAVHDVRERWGTKEAINPGRTMGKLAQTVKDFVVTDQDTLSTMVATVAGKDTTAHQVLYENVAKGESAQRLALRRAMDASGLKEWSARDMAAVNKDREITYSGGKVKLKGWEMMEILAAWGDPSTRAELEDAGFVKQEDRGRADRKLFFTDRDITAIEAAMTPKERTSIDPLRKALKMAYAEANDAHERMNGFRLPDTENHWSRTRAMEQTEREVGGELTKEAKRHNWFEDAGIFKDRSTTKAPVVIRNPFEWVPDQLHTLTGMAHLAEPIRAARRVMAAPEVKTEFAAKGGDKWVATMESRLAALAGTPGDSSPLNKLGQAALGIRARSKLAWRLSSIAKQKLGFLQAAAATPDAALGARIVAAGVDVRNMTPGARAKLRAEIDPRSGYLADRADPAFAEALASAANPHLITSSSRLVRGYQAFERAGMAGLQYADGDVVLGTYRAVRAHLAKTKGLTGDALKDAAVWETEKIIRESQNPTSVLDMSGLNLAGRRNAGIGFATLFTSSANKIRNQLRQAASDYAADPTAANGRQLAKVATLTATNAVASNLIGRVTKAATLAAAIAWLRGDRMDKKNEDQNVVGILADLADTAQPGLGEAIRIPAGQSFASGGFLSNLWSTSKKAVEAFGDEDMRGVDKADKVLRAVRALELLPDAPLDYAGQVMKGAAGPEPAGWSIIAALKRNDYKTALQRAQKLAALKLQKTKDGEPVDPADVQQSIEASIRAYLNRGLDKTRDADAIEENNTTARDLAADAMP